MSGFLWGVVGVLCFAGVASIVVAIIYTIDDIDRRFRAIVTICLILIITGSICSVLLAGHKGTMERDAAAQVETMQISGLYRPLGEKQQPSRGSTSVG
jgi:xanthine/uracil permease